MAIEAGQIIEDGGVKWTVRDIRSSSGGGVPIGTILHTLSLDPLPGTLALDGRLGELSRAVYPDLWKWAENGSGLLISDAEWLALAAVQSSVPYYSSGDGITTFRVPLMVDIAKGSSADRPPGTWQKGSVLVVDTIISDTSSKGIYGIASKTLATSSNQNIIYNDIGADPIINTDSYANVELHSTSNSTTYPVQGGNPGTAISGVSRPNNVSVLYCVQAFSEPVNQGTVDLAEVLNALEGKVNLTDFTSTQSLTESGWQKLPGGLIIQWGRVSINELNNYTITFPVAFSAAVFNIMGGWVGADSVVGNLGNVSRSLTGFGGNMFGAGAGTVEYIAIGY